MIPFLASLVGAVLGVCIAFALIAVIERNPHRATRLVALAALLAGLLSFSGELTACLHATTTKLTSSLSHPVTRR